MCAYLERLREGDKGSASEEVATREGGREDRSVISLNLERLEDQDQCDLVGTPSPRLLARVNQQTLDDPPCDLVPPARGSLALELEQSPDRLNQDPVSRLPHPRLLARQPQQRQDHLLEPIGRSLGVLEQDIGADDGVQAQQPPEEEVALLARLSSSRRRRRGHHQRQHSRSLLLRQPSNELSQRDGKALAGSLVGRPKPGDEAVDGVRSVGVVGGGRGRGGEVDRGE